MKCPNDDTVLVMSDRQGIEIDYCPECRGVWLDRGELDKIIERAPGAGGPTPAAAPAPEQYTHPPRPQPEHREYRPSHNEYHKGYDSHDYKKRKKEGFLGDLFDF